MFFGGKFNCCPNHHSGDSSSWIFSPTLMAMAGQPTLMAGQPNLTPLRNKGFSQPADHEGKPMVNKPLVKPYFWGEVSGKKEHWKKKEHVCPDPVRTTNPSLGVEISYDEIWGWNPSEQKHIDSCSHCLEISSKHREQTCFVCLTDILIYLLSNKHMVILGRYLS